MINALAVQMEESAEINPQLQREVDRILLRLRQSKAFQRAVGHTMSSNGYGSIRLDISKGKVRRVVSEAIFLEDENN